MSPRTGLILSTVLIQTLQIISGQDCAAKFQNGRDDFVLDTETSVSRGATFIASPTVVKGEECVLSCCREPLCNVALVEKRAEDSEGTCSLFNCLYKQDFICRFVRKEGFRTYVLNSVYEDHLQAPVIAAQKASPVAVAGRNVVVQPGQKVTLSGVESRASGDATITAYQWSLLHGEPSIVMEKTTLAAQLLVSNLAPGSYVFQLKVTDSDDQSDTAQVNILVLNLEESDLYCLATKDVGPCRASFSRWRYDSGSSACEKFIYGGCKGNRNNFLSEKECTAACSGIKASSEKIRSLSHKGEECSTSCETRGQYVCGNGCCLDHGLECDGVKQCSDGSDEDTCSQLNQTFAGLLAVRFDDNMARCTEAPKAGQCHGNLTSWYYNPHHQQCHQFTFGGCYGNDNNFDTKEICGQTCKGVTEKSIFAPGMFEELEESESGSIAIAVVLAVAIFVLLVALAYYFMKAQKKRSHQPVSTEPPLTHDGEHGDTVVYQSTTKPV